MRTFVHLVLFVCAIALAVGAFLPVIGGVAPNDVALVDLRSGFPDGWALGQIAAESVTFYKSMTALLLVAAALILLAALVGSRIAAWLGVLVGLATFAVFVWRLFDQYGDFIRDNYADLLNDRWGLYLAGGSLAIGLLACLVPRERSSASR